MGYSSDPNRDQIFYTFDWGDGSTMQTNLVNSGTAVRVPHTWSLAGTYQVRVMATDSNGASSLWSSSKKMIIKGPIRLVSPVTAKKTTPKSSEKTCPCQEKSSNK
jgi:hypothetical protein